MYPAGDWPYRSCLFRNICLDTVRDEWVLHVPEAGQAGQYPDGAWPRLATGVLNPNWQRKDYERIIFSPREQVSKIPSHATWAQDQPNLAAYAQQANTSGTVWLLWHSMASQNLGHLLWDDLLPLYKLRKLFGLGSTGLPLQVKWRGGDLWATCEDAAVNDGSRKQAGRDARLFGIDCGSRLAKWLPLLGLPSLPPVKTNMLQESSMVCFPWLATGTAMLYVSLLIEPGSWC